MTRGEERVSDEWASIAKESRTYQVFRKSQSPKSKTARAVRSCGRARHTNWRWRRHVRLLVPSLRRPPRAGRRVRPRAPSSAPRRPDPRPGRRRDAGIARVPRVARRGAAGRERDTWHTAIECRSDGDIIRLIRRCRRWNPGRDGRAGRPIATRERRRDFLGRARRCPSRACRGRVHADPRVSGEETLRVRCSIPIKSLSRFGNNARVAFALARRARASFGRAQARTWRPKPWSWRRPFY